MANGTRRPYIDWTRGLAVLVMIEAHTFDAWTSVVDRSTPAYGKLMILGGFAAPLFLWLAGLAGVLSAERAFQRTGNRRSAGLSLLRRATEVFALAFLFRLQAFILTPGGSLTTLLRVDILNVMGPSLMVVAAVWMTCPRRSVLIMAFCAATAAVALWTPGIRSAAWLAHLPALIQWYFRPAGEHTVFTMFPWAGFALAGGLVGAVLASSDDAEREARLQLGLASAGGLLAALGFYAASRPPLFAGSSFWTTSPEFFAIRVGILMVALALIYGLQTLLGVGGVALRPLARLGQASLFVYWIHVEMVYGYLSWPIRRNLRLPQVALAYGLFCVLMYLAVGVRDRVIANWANGSVGPPGGLRWSRTAQ